ncbi:helix-turn-helix domain-containing protein [Ralstonia pseudosolanacearum]|uniref:XRE family transcriptional regulator n=1 Tax=Ralstonia solanacearum TaxID=305 RepID=A0AA92EET5_RALSL|nr:helix-turn-helix transcriptional regulator [Ralstonia pseudosolanacearum]QCX49851.1 XRE family transcriptional regulator [Ralstonia pseudosolanacearum]
MIVDDHNFGDRLEQERKRLGLKKGEMAEAGSVSASAYGNYLRGERVPDLAALAAWTNAGADPLFIATGYHSPNLLTPEEEMVLAGYRKLDARGRAGVLALIGGMQSQVGATIKVQGKVGQYIDGNHTGSTSIDMGSGKKKR